MCALVDPWIRSFHHEAKIVHNITYDSFFLDSQWTHLYCQSSFTLLHQPLIAQRASTPHDINTTSVSWIKMSDCDVREHMCLKERYECVCGSMFLFECVCFIVCLSQCECAAITLSRLATVALAACGWRQTQLDSKQPFTVASLQSGLPTMQVYVDNSMEELTLC